MDEKEEPLYLWRVVREPTFTFFDFWDNNSIIVTKRDSEIFGVEWEIRVTINIYKEGVQDYAFGLGDTRREAFQDARKRLNENPWRVHKSYSNGLYDVYNIATKEYQHLGLTREKTALLYAQRLNEAQGA